jgi:hypothetical protein
MSAKPSDCELVSLPSEVSLEQVDIMLEPLSMAQSTRFGTTHSIVEELYAISHGSY